MSAWFPRADHQARLVERRNRNSQALQLNARNRHNLLVVLERPALVQVRVGKAEANGGDNIL